MMIATCLSKSNGVMGCTHFTFHYIFPYANLIIKITVNDDNMP